MTDIATALTELGVDEWVLRGEPTNKVEFDGGWADKSQVIKVVKL